MTKTATKRKPPANPKKGESHPDNQLARRVGNHPQLAAWWGRISAEMHWVQDELSCGSGPFENVDRKLASELCALLEYAWMQMAMKVPFGPPAEFHEGTSATVGSEQRTPTAEQLKAAVRAYANENLPGWATACISFRLGQIGAHITEALVVLSDADRKQEAHS